MKNSWFLILILTLLISACVNKQEKTFVLETEHPEDMMFEITNNGNYSTEFSMVVNDFDLSSNYKILEYIKNMPEYFPGEPLELKAFRFVHEYTWKDLDVSDENLCNNPSVLLNSVGGGLCGTRSAVLTNLLKMLGFDARCICLEGHVVIEVFANNKWQVLDVDYGVYYVNNAGQIASYEELIEKPEIFRDIRNYKALRDSESVLMNAFVFDNELVYSSIEDNKAYCTNYDIGTTDDNYSLPPHSKYSFPYQNCKRGDFFTTAKLEISSTWKGEFTIPLVLESIEGVGELLIDGEKVKCDGSLKNFRDINFVGCDIEILHCEKSFTVYYFINPLVYDVRESNQITFYGDNLSNISANLIERDNDRLYYHPSYRDYLLEFSFNRLKALNDSRGDTLFSSRESTIKIMCELCNDTTELLSKIQFCSLDRVESSDTIALGEYFERDIYNFFDRNCTSLDN